MREWFPDLCFSMLFCERKRRPYGTPLDLGGLAFPTLKRGANQHCASGAGVAGDTLKRDAKGIDAAPEARNFRPMREFRLG
jgi:hypothetical protein